MPDEDHRALATGSLAAPPAAAPDWPLPPLRPDLRLAPGPADSLGQPTWTLHDPGANRFYSLGWLERAALGRWPAGSAAALIGAVQRDTGHEMTEPRLRELLAFLARHHLLRTVEREAVAALAKAAAGAKPHPLSWLMHNYLFFRIPLLRPDRFLTATLPLVSGLMTGRFLVLMLVISGLGAALTVHQWDLFQSTFPYFFSAEGAVVYGICLSVAKVCHEFGHAWVAKSFGCRVPTMGIAFLVVWPVLYADTSEAWKLADRRHRLAIGIAGMAAELSVAGLALFLWDFLPEGPARSTAVVMASTSWLLALTVNLNPFMRFDGYYVFSDLLGIDNLQPRAFALARWRLRELLSGAGEPPPEALAPATSRTLLLYAYATWLYRLVVFLGIAVLVYAYVFKLLGIVLMGVEIFYFVLGPIVRELAVYWRRRATLSWNRHTAATVLALLLLALLLAVPWQSAVELPAVMVAREHSWLYPPFPARLVTLAAERGRTVHRGDVLALLEAPELDHDLLVVQTRIAGLRWQLGHRETQPQLLANTAVLAQELVTRVTEQAGTLERRQQLQVTAPFDGTVTGLADSLVPGRWLGRTLPLIELADLAAPRLEAFVSEDDLQWLAVGSAGRFYPDAPELAPLPVRVVAIDSTALAVLPRPQLASVNGGPIAVRQDDNHRLVPTRALYRIQLEPAAGTVPSDRVVAGAVRLAAAPAPLLQRLLTRAATVLVRESGF